MKQIKENYFLSTLIYSYLMHCLSWANNIMINKSKDNNIFFVIASFLDFLGIDAGK